MAVRIQAGWTLGASLASGFMTITESTGPKDFDVTCNGSGVQYDDSGGGAKSVSTANTQFSHETMSAVLGSGAYGGFAAALQSCLNSASSAHGNGLTYTVSHNNSAHTYTISASGAFHINFTTATAGIALQNLLGFAATTSSTGTTHTTTIRPYYTVLPNLGDKSKVSGDYEQGGLIQGGIANDGSHYSVSPQSLPTLYDFTMEFEYSPSSTRAGAGTAVFAADANTACPWAYQDCFQHLRANEPFLCVDDNESIVHYLRPDSAHFAPRRRQTDWNMFDVDFKTYMRGRL